MEPWDIASVVLAFAAVGWLVKVVASRDRDRDRHEEDEARAFFDRHGVWPDEVTDRLRRDEENGPPRSRSPRSVQRPR